MNLWFPGYGRARGSCLEEGHDGSSAQHRFILVKAPRRREPQAATEEATQALHIPSLSSRVSHTPATCWGLKFKIGSWNIEAAPATEALSPEWDTQRMPADPAQCARLSLVKAARGSRDTRPGQRRNRRGKRAGGIGGGTDSGARVRLGFVGAQASWPAPLLGWADWRRGRHGDPLSSHWPALPIKTATGVPRPFQHLPALDSARRSRWTSQYFAEFGGGKDVPVDGRERQARVEPQPFATTPSPVPPSSCSPHPTPARGDVAEIHFRERRCLGQEASRGQRRLGQNEIL